MSLTRVGYVGIVDGVHRLLTPKPHVQAFYWATSEWSAQQIEEAFRAYSEHLSSLVPSHGCFLDVASRLGLIGPIAEQCQHQ